MEQNVIDWADYTKEELSRFIGELEEEQKKRQEEKRQTLKEGYF